MEITVQAGKFKTNCLQLLNEVRKGNTYLITKRGVPVAKLSSLQTEPRRLFGIMKNSFTENGDIREPTENVWAVESD